MIDRSEILAQIRKAMNELFQTDPSRIQLESRLIEDLGLDSIDAIDLVARLEELSGQRLAGTQLRDLRTVSDVVDAVERLLATQTAGAGNTST